MNNLTATPSPLPPAPPPANEANARTNTPDFDAIRLTEMPASIRVCEQQIRLNGWMLGGMLQSAKARLPHGSFMTWLRENTDISQTTANDLMNLYDGVRQTPFLAELKPSAALALLSMAPVERAQFAADHDVESLTVRQLREEVEKVQREAARDAAQLDQANQRLLAVGNEAAAYRDAKEAEANQLRADAQRVTQMYEEVSTRFETASERIERLEQSLAEEPITLTTVEVEKEVIVPPADYEQIKSELARATEYAERMEQRAREAQTELRRAAQGGDERMNASTLTRMTMEFLGKSVLYVQRAGVTGYYPASAREHRELLDCVAALEDWCREARQTFNQTMLTDDAPDGVE